MASDFCSLTGLIRERQASHAVVGWTDGVPVTWQAFVGQVRAWERTLRQAPGVRFALYLQDSIAFAAALLGAWHAGKTVCLPADNLPATCAMLRRAVDGFLGEFDARWTPIGVPARDGETGPVPALLDEDMCAVVIYTSGTSGEAQAIAKKLSQLTAEIATLEALFGNRAGASQVVATVSHQHIYGLLFKVLWPLCASRPIHALSVPFIEQALPVLASRDCVLVSSPAHLKRLPVPDDETKTGLRLQCVFSSGGPLPAEAARETATILGCAPTEIYGSSETGGIAWRQRSMRDDESWTPMPGVDWAIDDESGLLRVRSAHLGNEDWFCMADWAEAGPRGGFQLRGRADRLVKIEEKRISLDAIERALAASALVAEVRVIAIEGRRQRIAAFIVLSADGRRALAEAGKLGLNRRLCQNLVDHVEAVAMPRVWRYLDALPVNAQGKTPQAALLALLGEAEADADASPVMPRHRWLERAERRAVLELVAPRELLYFRGHFDQAPILPGVVQVEWAIHYGRLCFDLPPVFLGMQALKFQQVITPEMPVTLELEQDEAGSALRFRLHSARGQHASGKILFGAKRV